VIALHGLGAKTPDLVVFRGLDEGLSSAVYAPLDENHLLGDRHLTSQPC